MKRIKEEFLDKLTDAISLSGSHVLEIGCGSGSRSVNIAKFCQKLTAIEPDPKLLQEAKTINARNNVEYFLGSAEEILFENQVFDITIFTLSLHHVPTEKISLAISEAVRVTKKGGYIVFLEPQHAGSFFQAEILFNACDGDERKQKARAYFELLNFTNYSEMSEIEDETIFEFDSTEDFIQAFSPKQNLDNLKAFLEAHHYKLNAMRRINIFQV